MTLITLSKIKRVCALALVPRVFRSDGCTPGKFHRLTFNGTQTARKSTVSDDPTDKEAIRCKKCKRIIEYAFGPPEVFIEKDKAANIPHVNLYAKPDLQKEPQQGEASENNEILAEIGEKFKEASKDKNAVTLLEDLKSKAVAEAKANMLLRARSVDMVLEKAGIEKREKLQDDTKRDNNYNLNQTTAMKNQKEEIGGKTATKDKAVKSNANDLGGQEINIMHSSASERGKFDVKFLANKITDTSTDRTAESKIVNEATHSSVGFSSSIADSKKVDATYLANAIESLKLESNPKLARSKRIRTSILSAAMESEDSTKATGTTKNTTLQSIETSNQNIASDAQTKQDDISNEVQSKKESVTLHTTVTKNDKFEPQEEKNAQVKLQDMTIENKTHPITVTTFTEEKDAKTTHASSTKKGECESVVNATNTKEHTSATMEKECSKATASKETDGKLTQEAEEINIPSLVADTKPKCDIINPPLTIGPGFLNVTPKQTAEQAMRAQIFDDIAKKYLRSSVKQIDNQLVKDMKQVNFLSNIKDEVMKEVNAQSNFKDEVIEQVGIQSNVKNEFMKQVNVQSNVRDEVIAQSANQYSEQPFTKHIAPLEKHTSKDSCPEVLSTQRESVKMTSETVNMEYNQGTILNEGYACEPLEPVVDSRILHLSNVRSGQDMYEKNEEEFRLEPEHRHPYHLFQTALIDSVNPAAPKNGVLIREYPTSFMAEPGKYTTPFDSPMPEYEWKYRGKSVTHNYTDASKSALGDQGFVGDVYMKSEENEALKSTGGREAVEHKDLETEEQQAAQVEAMENGLVLTQSQGANESRDSQETGANDCCDREKHETLLPTAGPILPKHEAEAIKPKDLGLGVQLPSQAVDMAQSFIQPLSHSQESNEGVPLTGTVVIDAALPDINLNDESVPLTEILRRVRERSRIMYCREIGLEMAKNFAALNPEGKCGDKKPECPPPAPTCPPPKCPPPPACPPPPCPKPCAPPPPKCPPPAAPKCAKYQAQDAVSLALHLGPIINTPRKALMPVLASNFSLPSSETDSSRWRFVIREKLLQLRKVLYSIIEESRSSSMESLKVFGSRDYTPWTPIPSWPYPVAQKKPRLQCPKEGCPFAPPPKVRPPCPEKPCTGFPKRLSFSNML